MAEVRLVTYVKCLQLSSNPQRVSNFKVALAQIFIQSQRNQVTHVILGYVFWSLSYYAIGSRIYNLNNILQLVNVPFCVMLIQVTIN